MALKEKPKSPREERIPVRSCIVYRDQILTVADKLSQLGQLSFQLWVSGSYGPPDFEGDNPADLESSKIPGRYTRLDMYLDLQPAEEEGPSSGRRSRVARLVVNLDSNHSAVWIRDREDSALLGHAVSIHEILQRHRRPAPKSLMELIIAAALLAFTAAGVMTTGSWNGPSGPPLIDVSNATTGFLVYGGCLAIALAILAPIGLRMGRERGGLVRIVNLADKPPGFFARTRDDWIVEVTVAAVFLAIGFAIGRAFPSG